MTKDVVDDNHRLSLVKNTFNTLIKMGCIPIVNENDSVSCDGIRFGGNDTLSAYVAIACDADIIINLSDIDGLFTADPRTSKDATLISRVDEIDDKIISYAFHETMSPFSTIILLIFKNAFLNQVIQMI